MLDLVGQYLRRQPITIKCTVGGSVISYFSEKHQEEFFYNQRRETFVTVRQEYTFYERYSLALKDLVNIAVSEGVYLYRYVDDGLTKYHFSPVILKEGILINPNKLPPKTLLSKKEVDEVLNG